MVGHRLLHRPAALLTYPARRRRAAAPVPTLVVGERERVLFGGVLGSPQRPPGRAHVHLLASVGGLVGSLVALHVPLSAGHPALTQRGQSGVVGVGRRAPPAARCASGEDVALAVLAAASDCARPRQPAASL